MRLIPGEESRWFENLMMVLFLVLVLRSRYWRVEHVSPLCWIRIVESCCWNSPSNILNPSCFHLIEDKQLLFNYRYLILNILLFLQKCIFTNAIVSTWSNIANLALWLFSIEAVLMLLIALVQPVLPVLAFHVFEQAFIGSLG